VEELFRFVLLRPADLAAADDLKPILAAFLAEGDQLPVARRKAEEFVGVGGFITALDELAYRRAAAAVVSALAKGPRPAADVSALVQQITGSPAGDIVGHTGFATEEQALADSLVAMKLLSSSRGADAPALAAVSVYRTGWAISRDNPS
jgi:hypothetical protein